MLLTSQPPRKAEAQPEQATDSIETLRQIITEQELCEISYDEAQEIGNSLIEFYQILAEEVSDESVD